jgi:hypothetical protein
MKTIKTQADLDKLSEVAKDETVIIESSTELILKSNITVFGILKIYSKVSFGYYRVVAMGNSSVEARENSSVEARENSSVVAWGNSSVEAWGNSSVEAWENSSVVAWGNSSVEARGNSSVEAWENSSVEAWENSSVEARENSSVKLAIRYSALVKIRLFGFSVCWKPINETIDVKIESKTALVQQYTNEKFLDREGVVVTDEKVILYKRVSHDLKTQENSPNETLWGIGKTLEHSSWKPTENECGKGKYHACSRPYFCDEFRSKQGDVYIAIEIHTSDLYEWVNGAYPHKIAFRKGTVLYQVNRLGKQL